MRQWAGSDSNRRLTDYESAAWESQDIENTGLTPSPPTARNTGRNTKPGIGPITDADLTRIVEAWPALPEPIRASIMAMVEAASGEPDE